MPVDWPGDMLEKPLQKAVNQLNKFGCILYTYLYVLSLCEPIKV